MDQSGPAIYFPPDSSVDSASAIHLAALAIGLAGVAWIVMICGLRWPVLLRTVSAAGALPTVAVAALTWTSPRWPARHESWTLLLLASVELALLAVIGLIHRFRPAVISWAGLRLMIAGWSCGAFGLFHMIGDYWLMMMYSDANWDTPPGTGYLPAVLLTGAAVATALITICPHPRRLVRKILSARPRSLQNVSEGV